ncbi:MAG: hypothetical protein ACLQVI_29135 [Polyangiaceae bacterium]
MFNYRKRSGLKTGLVVLSVLGLGASTASAQTALTESGSLTSGELTLAETLTDPWASTIAFSNGQIQIIPSACGDVDLAKLVSPPTITLPVPVVSEGGCDWGLEFTALSSPSFSGTTPFGSQASSASCPVPAPAVPGTLAFTSTGVQAMIAVAGTVHADAGNGGYCFWPSFDLPTSGTITVNLTWQPGTQTFSADASADLQYQVTNCWAGALCDDLLADLIGNVNPEVGAKLTSALDSTMSTPSSGFASAFDSVLSEPYNLTAPPAGYTEWGVTPGSIQFSSTNGGEFTYELSRSLIPPVCAAGAVQNCCPYARGCKTEGKETCNASGSAWGACEGAVETPPPVCSNTVCNGACCPEGDSCGVNADGMEACCPEGGCLKPGQHQN